MFFRLFFCKLLLLDQAEVESSSFQGCGAGINDPGAASSERLSVWYIAFLTKCLNIKQGHRRADAHLLGSVIL